MKIYEIMDEENRISVGVLLYYEKCGACIVELQEYLDEWTAPLLFTGLVKKHIFTMPADVSYMWVKERVIPSGRQNIGNILNTHKLKTYDEVKFLEISRGRCSQDNLYIRKIETLPEYVLQRMKKNLTECVVTGSDTVLCFFEDDTMRKIHLSEISQDDNVKKILKNRKLLESGKIGAGGYSMNFGGVIDIPSRIFYEAGSPIPLSLEDFREFTRKNISDTAESCNLLGCTRQNLAYLQEKQLVPVKENVKGNLYMKGDILRSRW